MYRRRALLGWIVIVVAAGASWGCSSAHSSVASETTLPCSAAALSARTGQPYYAEHVAHEILTNTGGDSCLLIGIPHVVLTDQNGAPLVKKNVTPAEQFSKPVTLKPHAAATFAVYWQNWCATYPETMKIEIDLDSGGSLTGPYLGNSKCLDSSNPSTVSVISAFTLGTR